MFVIKSEIKKKSKTMKHLSLLSSLVLFSFFSFSQVENYDLSKYKLPDIKRQQLDFTFQSNGQNTSSQSYYDHDNIRDTIKIEDHEFSGNYNLFYTFYRNTTTLQSALTTSLYGDYDKTTRENSWYNQVDNSNFRNHLAFNYDLKYFFTPSNWFITTAPRFDILHSKHNDYQSDNDWKNLYASSYLALGGGLGRIEQVQDFRHAILLIQEFDKRGVLKRNISEAEMTELSSLISQLKNKRFFDYRKQKEAELVALDSFLVDKGIIDEKSIQYFTGLEDIWSYGGLQIRESGKQVLFSITPGYSFDNIYDDSEDNIDESISMDYNLSFVSKKPISIKWQGDYGVGINHSYHKRLQQRNENVGEKYYYSRAFVNGQLGYYPNTRTYFDLSCTLAMFNSNNENILEKGKYSAGLNIVTSGYYYISEKLRMGYSLILNSNKNGIFNGDAKNAYYNTFNYNLTLNYAIF
jgi:hypothetical protein